VYIIYANAYRDDNLDNPTYSLSIEVCRRACQSEVYLNKIYYDCKLVARLNDAAAEAA
jgi:hypothetical protein